MFVIKLSKRELLQEHESSYVGIYFKSTFKNASLHLGENYNKLENDWNCPKYKELNILLSFSISTGKKKERIETSEFLSATFEKLGFIEYSSSEFQTV